MMIISTYGNISPSRHAPILLSTPVSTRRSYFLLAWQVKGKYTLIARDYGKAAGASANSSANSANKAPEKVPESELDPRVQGLLRLVCARSTLEAGMREVGFDAAQLPLGQLTKVCEFAEIFAEIFDAAQLPLGQLTKVCTAAAVVVVVVVVVV